MKPMAILTFPGRITDDMAERIRHQWLEAQKRPDAVLVLSEGAHLEWIERPFALGAVSRMLAEIGAGL